MMISDSITIFTDGSSRGNPGPGGYAAIIILPEQNDNGGTIHELGGKEGHTTNNRMELTAAIEALAFVQSQGLVLGREKDRILIFYSDSSYVINGITKWIQGWQKNNWKTKAKEEILNRDLWEKLALAVKNKTIKWKYVESHIGIAGNERCDQIATEFALGKKPDLYSGPKEKYQIKNILNLQGQVFDRKKDSILKRNRMRLSAFSYVSQVRGKIMTHKTWAECEAKVKGISGVKFKKSLNKSDEEEIIKKWEREEKV